MILCRCIAKFCILKSKWDNIGFLDPLRVNEKTCLGLYGCDVEDLKQRLIAVFDEFTMIDVWDSKKKSFHHLDALVAVLN